MNPVKIIFFDIDGTLVDPATKRISPKNQEALRRLREKGILTCIATGRVPVAFPDFGEAEFDGVCAINGGLCYTENTVIYANAISPKSVEQVLKNAEALGRPVSLAVRNGLSANGFDRDLADYYGLSELALTVSDTFEEDCRGDVYQIMLGCREADFPAILRGTDDVKIAVSWERAVDVIPVSGGKGAGIAAMLKYFQLTPADALAFGDSYNDLEMLQAVDTGIAMGNAAEALKEIANGICRPVSEDGIYHYCIENGLI